MTEPIDLATARLAEALRDVVVAALATRESAPVDRPSGDVDWHPQRGYTIAQVAEWMRTGTSYVYDEVKAGRLRMADLGNGDRRKERVRGLDLEAWWESRYV